MIESKIIFLASSQFKMDLSVSKSISSDSKPAILSDEITSLIFSSSVYFFDV